MADDPSEYGCSECGHDESGVAGGAPLQLVVHHQQEQKNYLALHNVDCPDTVSGK